MKVSNDFTVVSLFSQEQRVEDILDKVRKEDLSTAELLNAKDSHTQSNFPDTAMHIACRIGNVVLIRTLMAAGARWDLPGKTEQTAEQEAEPLERGNPDIHRKIMELLSYPMPPAPSGYRSACVCVRVCVCAVRVRLVID